jgi:hypothetical protein
MKKVIFISLLLLFVKNNWAQNPNLSYKRAIKIYNLSSYQRINYIIHEPTRSIEESNKNWQLFHPTIAFQWKTKKNNFHELELVDLGLNKNSQKKEINYYDNHTMPFTINGYKTSTTFISLRYEFILNLIKSKDVKWVPSLGFSYNAFYERIKNKPIISTYFPSYNQTIGGVACIIPRINYYINSRFFLDLNIPICIVENAYNTSRTENPSIPKDNRRVSRFDMSLFPNMFTARLGIGIKL